MNIVQQPWYPALCKAAQLSAEDILSAALMAETRDAENPYTREQFSEDHNFWDAFDTAFGDTEDAEFDWNANQAVMWICGMRPRIDETEAGHVLTWTATHPYDRSIKFTEAYMEASKALQHLFWGDHAYVQRSFLTILEKLTQTHKLWRMETAPEHLFVLEYAVVPNQPLV